MSISSALPLLIRREDLDRDLARSCARELIAGTVDPILAGAFLACLSAKGETIDEITGIAEIMQEAAKQVVFDFPVLDTCGTGGDALKTFNISTAAAFVAAGSGVKVAKHGNRSVTSKSGSADVLEALGIAITLSPELVAKCVTEVGIGFFFAPNFHPAMKNIIPVRKTLGIRTIFNILGPLISPSLAQHQVMGVPTAALGETLIQVFQNLGSKHVLIVHGEDGMDEISLSAPTQVWEYRADNDSIRSYTITPEKFGCSLSPLPQFQVKNVEESAATLQGILTGSITDARKTIVQLNAAAGLIAYDSTDDWQEAFATAGTAISSGKAWKKVQRLRERQG